MVRINRALLAAFLCAGGPVATSGMCGPFEPTSPLSSAQWTTLPASVPELRRTDTASPTMSFGAPPMATPAVALLNLPEGDAWNLVKTTVGENVVALRPTWLPTRFRSAKVMVEYAYTNFPRYRVGYATDDALILVAVGAVNSASPDQSIAIDIGGVTATYSVTSSWPERQVGWEQSGVFYSIQARGVTESELLRVARGLVEVSVIATGADPQLAIVPALPSTSTAPDHEPESGLR